MLQENLLNLIREKCAAHWELNLFPDHIIINLPADETDFRSACQQVKLEITACVKAYFPERDLYVLFEIRSGAWNSSFKIGKTVCELETQQPLSEKDEQYKAIERTNKGAGEAREKWDKLKNKQ
jgi:hypothetical protein